MMGWFRWGGFGLTKLGETREGLLSFFFCPLQFHPTHLLFFQGVFIHF